MKPYIKLVFIFIMILMTAIPITASADVGPKPSLKIYVKNFETQDYFLDVLVQGDEERFNDINRKYSEEYKELLLYKYNEGGWQARHIRTSMLFGSLKGEYDKRRDMMVHSFSYYAVPQTFKVIIQDADGGLFVSDAVTTSQFNANVILDRGTGEIKVVRASYANLIGNTAALAWTVFVCMFLTILIELLIAIPFKARPLGTVVWVNALTQILLQAELITLFYLGKYSIMNSAFIALEAFIVFIEYRLYTRHLVNIKKKRIFYYVLVANLTTFLLGLIIQI